LLEPWSLERVGGCCRGGGGCALLRLLAMAPIKVEAQPGLEGRGARSRGGRRGGRWRLPSSTPCWAGVALLGACGDCSSLASRPKQQSVLAPCC
jgi:hypothetical protein